MQSPYTGATSRDFCPMAPPVELQRRHQPGLGPSCLTERDSPSV